MIWFLLVWVLSSISPLPGVMRILSCMIFNVILILIFCLISLPYQLFFIDFILFVRTFFVLSVHTNDLSLILFNPLLFIWVIFWIIVVFILWLVLAIIFINLIPDVWVNPASMLVNVLWLWVLLTLLGWCRLSMTLTVLLLLTASLLILPLKLLALVELVADSSVVDWTTLDVLESVVVTIYFQIIGNYVLDSIVVTHYFYGVNNSKLASFWENLVVVTRYQHIWNSDSWSYFDFAIMASQDYVITRFHQSHAHRMIGDVDWTFHSSRAWHVLASSTSTWVLLVGILHVRHPTLASKSITKVLLEIYNEHKRYEFLMFFIFS